MIKDTDEAVAALIEHYLNKTEIKAVKKALTDAGIPDSSFVGVIKSAFLKLGSKVAADAGEAAAKQVAEFLTPILEGVGEKVLENAKGLFSDEHA